MQHEIDAREIEAVVAGHICLDIIPALPPSETAWQYRPGVLVEVGPAAVATGGCVCNAGQVLHRLGVPTLLVGKLGDDAFGIVVRDVLARASAELSRGLLMVPGEHTSYSVVIYPPGNDRMFLHFPGANDTFTSDDIPDEVFAQGRIFHFGYPPLMGRMYEGTGLELVRIMQRAKRAGLTTGLDMAYPDPEKASGKADWLAILATALPLVDVFVPSLEEVSYMLGSSADLAEALGSAGERAGHIAEHVSRLSRKLLDMGAGMVGIKAGDLGFYLRTGTAERLRAAGRAAPRDCEAWADREIWSSVFRASLVGTVGAGDATVAGFIFGLLRDMSPEQAVTAACAAGASSVEAADATSGVVAWEALRSRIDAGWARAALDLGFRLAAFRNRRSVARSARLEQDRGPGTAMERRPTLSEASSPTLRDVAREAGVSSMTVSRVVNGAPRVGSTTAQRVQAAIAKLGYRPDYAARALKGGPSRTIALMIADFSNPFYSECAQAVEEAARARGYALLLCATDERADVERERMELLVPRRIDGLLLVPASAVARGPREPLRVPFPVVALDRPLPGLATDAVLARNRAGAEAATRHLIDHGHRRIAFLGAGRHLYTTRTRAGGYRSAMHAAGLDPRVVTGVPSPPEAKRAALALLAEPEPPTAFFAMNNLIVVGVLDALAERGRSVPRDVALVGFDDFALASLLRPRLTLVRHSAANLGRDAAALLFDRIDTPDLPPRRVILPAELIVRESCGCAQT